MDKKKLIQIGIACSTFLLSTSLPAQTTERTRPAEWDQLVKGGRYMDRFEAMPEGKLVDNVWGADSVRPRFVDNGIERPDISFWGGNILRTEDGKFHLFVCGWPESAPKGHMTWPNSTVYHTVSDRLSGPYAIQDTIGKGHNPEAFRLDDGRIVMDGEPREIFSRVKELKSHGLDVPQATELAYELREAGMPLPEGILSREELAQALAPLLGCR